MWHCPKCGEQVDDVFDACWNCGTAQDGIVASNLDPELRDPNAPRSTPEPSDELAADSAAAPGHAEHGRIVELCSAADLNEAYSFCALLEEAGIRSRVVGEFLGIAAGSLPLGQTTAPRILVREEDAARAQEIIGEQIDQPWQASSGHAGNDEDTETDAVSEEESPPPVSGIGFRWLGQGLVLGGLACILLGAVWAGLNWRTMRECSGTTEGVLVHYRPHVDFYSPPPPEIPLPREPTTFSVSYDARYAFVIKGKTFYSKKDRDSERPLGRVSIHYDPHHPATNFVGSLTLPWLILAWALGIGGFLSLVGYCLQSGKVKGANANSGA
jgi:hypothetical protein